MNGKSLVKIITYSGILSIAVLAVLITQITPSRAGIFGKITAFVSFYIFFLALFFWIGLIVRNKTQGIFIKHCVSSFRQAAEISLFLTLCLLFSSFGILFWWLVASFAAVFVFIETHLYISSQKLQN